MKVEIMNVAEFNTETQEQLLQFKKFTKQESGVYGLVCPQKNIYEYDKILEMTDIPERIKELVEMTKERFHKYEIWEASSYEIKDPIILGRECDPKNPTYSWYDKIYFLGRWGEELEPFSALMEKAKKMLVNRSRIALIKAKADIDSRLQNVELFVENAIERGEISEPSISLGCVQ